MCHYYHEVGICGPLTPCNLPPRGDSFMTANRLAIWALALALGLRVCPSAFAQADSDLLAQKEKQQQIQADTDEVVRRLTTMLRVMQFYGGKESQAKSLESMKTTLAGLSKEQMTEVIRRLEEAAKATDEKQSEKAIEAAYANHRVVIDTIKEMLNRYDAIKSLDQAADRFEKLAKHQLGIHLQTGQIIRDEEDRANPNTRPTRGLLIGQRQKGLNPIKFVADAQSEVGKDVTLIYNQVLGLRAILPADQKERVGNMEKLSAEFRLHESLSNATQNLQSPTYVVNRTEKIRTANDLQFKCASQLQELARVLRLP